MATAVLEGLRQEVLEELEWEPKIGTSQVDVNVAGHGIDTLTGLVKSYAEKVAARWNGMFSSHTTPSRPEWRTDGCG